MRSNNEQAVESTNRMKSKSIPYVFFVICISDWLYKLLRIMINFNITIIIDYFSYIIYLWKLNPIVTTLVMIIGLIGIPKFSKFLRSILNTFQQILKTLIKNPVIIDIPLYFFLLIFCLKFYPFSTNLNDTKNQPVNVTTNGNTFFKEIIKGPIVYPFSSLMSIILIAFGIDAIISNRLVIQASKRVLSMFSKQIKDVYLALTIRIPMPLSFVILIFLNICIRLLPSIALQSYYLLTNRSFILFVIALICLNNIFKWLKPDQKLEINLTSDIYLNDVSGMNKTRISSIFYPRTINDIQYLVLKAKSQGKTISIRGQAHTMGGHTLPSSMNYVCDLKYMNRVEYDETSEEVWAEAGTTWTHVINKLNEYGRSPVVMQSYCTFSVGGTISVNAHGITSDDVMCKSVVEIEYIDFNGIKQECNRETNGELFSLIIGGYGLFGIMTRLRLKTVPNVKTKLEYIRLQSDQFSTHYEEFLNDPTIEIKIARVDLVRPNNILMFVFRRQSTTSTTVADLSDEARVMHPRQHLMYTYLAQHRLFRRIRFALEKMFARPLDLSLSSDRNTIMYESAKPMALLYQPLRFYDDTFILQEYFVPKKSFRQWYDKLKPIIRQKYENLFLLNLTIRFVKNDQTTFLAYTKKNDCYAFVFYFRVKRNELGDRQARELHQKLIKLTFEYQGTFYLPYRHHYSYEQLSIAYPMIDQFFAKKLIYDPIRLFSNSWYENYRSKNEILTASKSITNEIELITDEFQIVKQRRMHSFRDVILNDRQREKFRKFLRTVFNAEPVHVIFNYVNRAVRNPANENDHDMYRELQNSLKTRQFAFIRGLFALIKQILQLREQVKDLLRQQISIFNKLGYGGKVKDIVSIGDGGRCINELRQMLEIKDGHVFVINERERLTDIIERNSLFRLGTFIPYNFKQLTDVPIPSGSIDLVVCYMGIHHLPQEQISIFLKMIYRILRPNGLFIFREHNAYEELIPLLDVAHMVFNAVTGVDYESEINETRAFRTIEQWRSCLRQIGFQDTFIYDEQEDDPTDDIMIVFRKPIEENLNVDNDLNEIVENGIYEKISAIEESNYFRPCEWFIVRICMEFGQYLNHTPFHKFPYMKFLSHYWSLFYIETSLVVEKFGIKAAIVGSPGFIMNGFIGILLSVAFLQMAFISFLILNFSGKTKPEYEQLVLEQTEDIDNKNFNFQESIDHRIDNVQVLKEKRCYAIRIPRHHVYTSILKKLALHRAKFNLLRISNLDGQIQMELTVNNNDEQRLLWLKQHSAINVIFEYKNPADIKKTHLIIAAKIKYLFVFLRDCANFEADHSLTIVQIFDHFDWYLPE